MNGSITIPVGWVPLEGRPIFEIVIPPAPTHVLLSDASLERVRRIFGPLPFVGNVAVGKTMEQFHTDDGATYHEQRPSVKTCPFDPACRFV